MIELFFADSAGSHSNACSAMADCPATCKCQNNTVDCSHTGLEEIPANIPQATVSLILSDNRIRKVEANGLFNRLPRLAHLDLSRNDIQEVEEGAFEGAESLKEM